jgi:predicted phage-related endonuclease
MGVVELNKKVTEIKELEQYAKEIQAEIDGLKDEVKAEMDRQGADEITVGVLTVRWKEVVSHRFDSKRFKADHEDMYTAYTKENKSKRFTIQ